MPLLWADVAGLKGGAHWALSLRRGGVSRGRWPVARQ
jgi:hypothetical protein